MLKIGEFSKLSRVSIRMLRRYNEVGLLLPAETDPITGYRYYSEEQLPAAGRITALRDMGFGLAAIEQLLATWEEPTLLEVLLMRNRRSSRKKLSCSSAACGLWRPSDSACERKITPWITP